jgi:hypothetical protein
LLTSRQAAVNQLMVCAPGAFLVVREASLAIVRD